MSEIYKIINGKATKVAETTIINHNDLVGRNDYGAHSCQSIRGLPEKLTALKNEDEKISGKITEEIGKVNQRITEEVETLNTTIGNEVTAREDADRIEKEARESADADITTKAQQINIEPLNNGKFRFANYGATNVVDIQGGYLPDDETIELEDKLVEIYADVELDETTYEPNTYYILVDGEFVLATGEFDGNETYYAKGTSTEKRLVALALQTEKGLLSGEVIRQVISTKAGYLDSNNFGKIVLSQEELINYAIQDIGDETAVHSEGVLTEEEYNTYPYLYYTEQHSDTTIYKRSEEYVAGKIYYTLRIWDKTRVINLFTDKTHSQPDTWQWDINSNSWSNLGFIEMLADANNEGLHGLITGAPNTPDNIYMGYVDEHGYIHIYQLPELAGQVGENTSRLANLIATKYYNEDDSKTYSAKYVNEHFAPLSFIGKLYLEKDANDNILIVDNAPQTSETNILQVNTSNHTTIDFENDTPDLVLERDLQYSVTLNDTNSFTVHLYFSINRPEEIAFGARIKYKKENDVEWTLLNNGQEFASTDYIAEDQDQNPILNGTVFTIYTENLTEDTEFKIGDTIAIEIYKKQLDDSQLKTTYYFGSFIKDTNQQVIINNIYSYLEFNYLNTRISTDQLEDNSVTYQKLSNELQEEIDKITPNSENISNLQENKQDKNIYFTNISVPANTWLSDNTYPDYPYKATITLNGIDATMIPTMTFGMNESLSGNYSTICNTVINGLEVWSKVAESITIPVIMITKTFMNIDIEYEINGAGGYTQTIRNVEYTTTPNDFGGETLTISDISNINIIGE